MFLGFYYVKAFINRLVKLLFKHPILVFNLIYEKLFPFEFFYELTELIKDFLFMAFGFIPLLCGAK